MQKYTSFALSFLAFVFLVLSTASSARADYLTVGLGDWNVFRKNEHALWYSAQYRSDYVWDKFLANVGVGGNDQGGVYGYVGAQYDWHLVGNFYMLPGFGVGAYHQGGSKDLGGVLEFKSSIEADYQFDSGWRAGVSLWHISNAGIYTRNPGTETIEATISIPFGLIVGSH